MTASSEPTSDRPIFFDQLVATVEQLSATHSVLRHIIALAADSATLSIWRTAGPANRTD